MDADGEISGVLVGRSLENSAECEERRGLRITESSSRYLWWLQMRLSVAWFRLSRLVMKIGAEPTSLWSVLTS